MFTCVPSLCILTAALYISNEKIIMYRPVELGIFKVIKRIWRYRSVLFHHAKRVEDLAEVRDGGSLVPGVTFV